MNLCCVVKKLISIMFQFLRPNESCLNANKKRFCSFCHLHVLLQIVYVSVMRRRGCHYTVKQSMANRVWIVCFFIFFTFICSWLSDKSLIEIVICIVNISIYRIFICKFSSVRLRTLHGFTYSYDCSLSNLPIVALLFMSNTPFSFLLPVVTVLI